MTVYVDEANIPARVGRVSGNWSHLFAGPETTSPSSTPSPRRSGCAGAFVGDAAHPVITAESPAAVVADLRLPAGRIRAITLRQPWATAVAELGKRVENRTWRLPPGYLWIHAGARSGWDPAASAHPAFAAAWRQRRGDVAAGPGLVMFSAVVALVRVTGAHHAADCTRAESRRCDPWAVGGQVHNILELAAVLPEPVRAAGQQRLWLLPPPAESACRVQLAV